MSRIAGIDLGGTNLRIGLVDQTAVVWEHRINVRFSERCSRDDPARSTELVLQEVQEAVRHTLAHHPDVAAVGIALPGIVEPGSGRLLEAPNLPGIRDLDLAGILAQRFGLPFLVENDALAAAWGAFQTHPERPASLIFLGLGTGIGGGLILDGKPYRGGHGFAMEVGHMEAVPYGRACGCGARGCLERYASATGVTLSYREATGESLTSAEVASRARDGDGHAVAAFNVAGAHLGGACADLMKVLDVTDLVVGGGLCASWDLMAPAFGEAVTRRTMVSLRDRYTVRVLDTASELGMLGAALLAKQLKDSLS